MSASRRHLTGAILALLGLSAGPEQLRADAVSGAWSEVFDWPEVAVHMMQLHTGEILWWSDKGAEAFVLDPEGDCFDVSDPDGCFTPKPNPINIFCGGHSHLDDGSILVTGGHVRNNVGHAETHLFQYDQNLGEWNWTETGELEDAAFARWYPTLTTLADGTVLNMSGSEKRCTAGPDFDDLCEFHSDCGPEDSENCEAQLIATPELFDPVTREWTELTGITDSVQFYPFNFVDPDGNVFFAGADSGLGGADIPDNQSATFEVSENEGVVLGPASDQDGGSAAMYEPGKILKCGGTDADGTVGVSEIIDLDGAAVWQFTGDLNIARRRHNLTMLPDGTALVTGGTRQGNREFEIERTCGGTDEGAECGDDDDCDPPDTCEKHPVGDQLWVAEAEIWDPATGDWSLMAGAQVPRMYHSTAILLADGRVLSAGGGPAGFGGAVNSYPNAEIFSPPYLFTGTPAPTIAEAPEIIYYGEVFEVESPEADDVDKVSLIRLAAVTHSFDQNRRFVPLPFNDSGDDELDINAPVSPNDAPPGYYMLFLVSSEGVPSTARFVRLLHRDPGAGAPFEYSAKVVCGAPGPDDEPRLEPGHYATSVNIHNPGPGPVRFYKKLALTYPPGDQLGGQVLPIGVDELGYDEALQSDCADLRRRLIPGDSAPFFEGFLVIQSRGSLDVTTVYSTAAVDGNGEPTTHSSVDVEQVRERRRTTDLRINKTVVVLPPAQLNDKVFFYVALYSIQVTNSGPNTAGDVVLSDELAMDAVNAIGVVAIVPDPITLPPGAQITATAQPALNLSSMEIELPDLAPGDTAAVHFWALALVLLGDSDPHAELRDTATVESSLAEATPANNMITIETVLIP